MENALDIGIKESDFWEMTIAELNREVESYQRRKIQESKLRASFDYTLAQMIGLSVNRAINGSDSDYPTMEEIYPTLFKEKSSQQAEAKADSKAMAFAIQLKQFSQQHNEKINKKGVKDE